MKFGKTTLQEVSSLIELLGDSYVIKVILGDREFSRMKYGELNLGQVEAVINKLGGIEGAQRFLRGELGVVEKKHIIDCDADPFVPDGWKVVEHQPGGQFEWDPDKVELYLCDEQKQGLIEGKKLRKKLYNMPVMNANVLDYLLKHSELIPEEWKRKFIFFWGTIYCSPGGYQSARCLSWNGFKWVGNFDRLDNSWFDFFPAILLK